MNRIVVRSDTGSGVKGAHVLVLFPNQTYKAFDTNDAGVANVVLYRNDLPMEVFVAARGYHGVHRETWQPLKGALHVELTPTGRTAGGSLIFRNGTGYVPGLGERVYIYREAGVTRLKVDNIAVEDAVKALPSAHEHEVPVKLMNAEGDIFYVTILHVDGQSVLLDWWQVQKVRKEWSETVQVPVQAETSEEHGIKAPKTYGRAITDFKARTDNFLAVNWGRSGVPPTGDTITLTVRLARQTIELLKMLSESTGDTDILKAFCALADEMSGEEESGGC